MNEAKDSPKKNLKNRINRKFNNIGSADKNKCKMSLQQFLPLSEA
jgi:hypothetical protein